MAMKEVKKVDVVSFATVMGFIYAVFGFIVGIFTVLLGSVGAMVGMNIGFFGIIAIIVYPIMLFILGFIGAAICAIVYNYIASKVGGIKIDLV
jgi:uncharacterized membrane protein YeaQ/YmgE (transglycosylase-associated protein family)